MHLHNLRELIDHEPQRRLREPAPIRQPDPFIRHGGRQLALPRGREFRPRGRFPERREAAGAGPVGVAVGFQGGGGGREKG